MLRSALIILIVVTPSFAEFGFRLGSQYTAGVPSKSIGSDKERKKRSVFHQFRAGNTTVSLSGRVLTPGGRSIRNATIILMDLDGPTQIAVSGSVGYYSFTGIVPGRTYVLGVFHPRYLFASPTQTIEINADQTGVILIGEEDWL